MNSLLTFLAKYQTQNIIAVFALILAYLVYRKSVIDGYRSWLDLVKSFQSELNYAKEWIGNAYNGNILKEWSDCSKFYYPLTSEAAKALIQKGHPPKGLFPDDFFDNLAIYNERIQAFNYISMMQGINYIISGLENKEEKNTNSPVFPAKATHLNNIVKNELIGDDGKYHLHHLYEYFQCELKMIKRNDLSMIPWYFKCPRFVTVTTLFIYLMVDYFIS